MQCPECGRRFSFLYSFRILNPNRFACPSCATILTAGRYGNATRIVGAIIGAAIAAVAIYMEKRGGWVTLDSIVWFAIALPIVIIPYQWICWRFCTVARLTASEHIDVKRPTYLALTLAVLCWALFLTGFAWPSEPSKVYRLMGFVLGGMASVLTTILCGYYYWFRAVRTTGLKAALTLSTVYIMIFLVFISLVLAGSPMAFKWL